MDKLNVLGIPGSLRVGSFNRRLLEEAARLAPGHVDLAVYEGLGEIPLFNEDLEGSGHPALAGVERLREAIDTADVLLIATAEYNQSIPGVLKNAIDWISRPPRDLLRGKPVALMGSTVGEWGTRLSQAALRQTLFACGVRLVQGPHIYIRRASEIWMEDGRADAATAAALQTLLAALAAETERIPRKMWVAA